MLRFLGIVLILLVAGSCFSQKVASGEGPQSASRQDREIENDEIDVVMDRDGLLNAAGPISILSVNEQALSFRRSAQFYAWHDSCYTQDRHRNWYRIDARLC